MSKTAGPLMKIAVQLAKVVLASLRMTVDVSAIDVGIQNKIHGSGKTALIILNEEKNDIMKIVQALENSNILFKGITKTIENEASEQKSDF